MKTSAPRKLKEAKVVEIKNALTAASGLVIAEYRGLKVSELENLRKELKSAGVKTKVYKNRLVKLAVADLNLEGLNEVLVGPNMFLFNGADDLAAAKIVAKFAKKHKEVVIKGGIYEAKFASASDVEKIATLPSYEEALTILATSLLAPVRQVAVGLNMLVEENKLPAE
ncbi:50S ribosomal protein L10 [Candidatus Mycoplasma pogonae]